MSGDATRDGYGGHDGYGGGRGPAGAVVRSVGGGRYVLRDELGRGGMASVHLAHDTVLDRPVAVKTLHTNLGTEQSFRERFRREAQSVAKLNHTNIVSVFDSGEDMVDGELVPYIVMEYVEGQPLGDVLAADVAQYGAMPADKALRITGDVLAALAVSHEMGLVHRDIKPGNVMVTRRGVVKVMDFGIARAMQSGVTSMTQTGMVVGTPQYLSPEQALGRGVDERSDLYSVGCMLFELLTGQLPFDADSPLAMAYQHVQETPPAPSSYNTALSPAVDALVARALRKNPAERFPTADAMHDEADRVLAATQRGTMPLISGRTATSRGEGVAAAVFPTAPPPGQAPAPQVHTPYGPPAPVQPQGGFGPAAGPAHHAHPAHPAPHSAPPAAYGYPQPGQGTPPPVPSYNLSGGGYDGRSSRRPAGGRRSNAGVAIGATVAVAAIAVIVAVVVATTRSASSSDDAGSGGQSGSPAPQTSASVAQTPPPTGDGIVRGDQSRTIDSTKCTDAHNDLINPNEPDVMTMPDFSSIYVDSAVACIRAAHWKYLIKHIDEQQWGQGSVIDQSPKDLKDYEPKTDPPITLWVSTGKSATG